MLIPQCQLCLFSHVFPILPCLLFLVMLFLADSLRLKCLSMSFCFFFVLFPQPWNYVDCRLSMSCRFYYFSSCLFLFMPRLSDVMLPPLSLFPVFALFQSFTTLLPSSYSSSSSPDYIFCFFPSGLI